jgi:uncharacterized membrane protein
MDKKRGINIIIINSIIAVISSVYLLYIHYSDTSSFCDISKGLSCDIVNRSLYSEIFNIPVSLFSLLTFIFILIISFYIKNNKEFSGFNKKELINIIYYLMIFILLFALYLIYIEAFVLYSFCILCILLDIIILVIFIITIKLRREK